MKTSKSHSEINWPLEYVKFNVKFLSLFLFQGVVEFSLCLFFAKLVSYTFLYWLPTFIKESGTKLIFLIVFRSQNPLHRKWLKTRKICLLDEKNFNFGHVTYYSVLRILFTFCFRIRSFLCNLFVTLENDTGYLISKWHK